MVGDVLQVVVAGFRMRPELLFVGLLRLALRLSVAGGRGSVGAGGGEGGAAGEAVLAPLESVSGLEHVVQSRIFETGVHLKLEKSI